MLVEIRKYLSTLPYSIQSTVEYIYKTINIPCYKTYVTSAGSCSDSRLEHGNQDSAISTKSVALDDICRLPPHSRSLAPIKIHNRSIDPAAALQESPTSEDNIYELSVGYSMKVYKNVREKYSLQENSKRPTGGTLFGYGMDQMLGTF